MGVLEMKQFIVAAAMVLGLSQAASAADYYAEFFGGVSSSPDLTWGGSDYNMDNGHNIGGSLGRTIAPTITAELEAFHTTRDYACCTSSLRSLSIMGNVYYTMPFNMVDLYVGPGLGMINVEYDGYGTTDGEWVPGWQLIGGLTVPVYKDVSLLGEYRYQNTFSDASINGGTDVEYLSHNLSIGLRIKF